MGAFDAIIQLLLYVAFGVYVVMGLALLGLGGWYINDVGAVGATATWLLLFGFAMLVIGGLAIFANLKKIWLLLFIIELINVALFLVRNPPLRTNTPSYSPTRNPRNPRNFRNPVIRTPLVLGRAPAG
jgi:hypothetical protein